MRNTCFLLCLFFTLSSKVLAISCPAALEFNPGDDDYWQGWGGNDSNTRFNNSDNNPISSSTLQNLQLKWVFGFDNVRSVIGNPALHGNRIFIGDENGRVYSLDRESGCEDWIFQAGNGVRTMPLIENINGRWTVFFGDRSANFYALDAVTGEHLWETKVDDHPAAILTGAPQYVNLENASEGHRLIVPVSSGEEGLGAVPSYPCCSFQGSVVTLNALNGETIWKTYTIQEPVSENSDGKIGPSGAAIWSAPTIDIDSNHLFVTTGDAYSAPADIGTDAVISMDLTTGDILWINQGSSDDIWTVICMTPNAFDECGPDHDFGSPSMMVTVNDMEILVAGQKSGIVRAYNKKNGESLWQTALVDNTTEFGGKIVWGGASDTDSSYWGINNNVIAAVSHLDGSIRWTQELPPVAGMENYPGLEGPVTLSHDVLFSGSWDGMLRALSSSTGEVLWDFNTAVNFETVNDVAANGGSLGAVGQVVEDGLLLVTSGYVGVKNGATGNVLLVFELVP
jgi:polyvinyl alcohol dehydrogenase (cytochrome)